MLFFILTLISLYTSFSTSNFASNSRTLADFVALRGYTEFEEPTCEAGLNGFVFLLVRLTDKCQNASLGGYDLYCVLQNDDTTGTFNLTLFKDHNCQQQFPNDDNPLTYFPYYRCRRSGLFYGLTPFMYVSAETL